MRRLLLVVCLAGCPADEPPECKTVDVTCSPLYEPTFENVHSMTLVGCATSSCHSAARRAGDLSLADRQTAYDSLIQKGYVVPGNPGCSEFIVRTNSPGEDYQMPPGSPLDDPEQCALIQWVQAGAMP